MPLPSTCLKGQEGKIQHLDYKEYYVKQVQVRA